ncbi:MAG: hypothetical protein QOH99_216 [Frankiaceae bacterium]|nr:hypothetical protein [Frankiaceae bacterium]
MTTPDDPNAQGWNAPPPVPPAEGQPPPNSQQPYGQQPYGQPPQAPPPYGQQPYPQPGAYPQLGYPSDTMIGKSMGFGEAIKTCLQKYATFSGRARRPEYWYFFLFNFVLGFVAGLIDGRNSSVLQIVIGLAFFLPSLAVGVRRLHDTGKSGWWILIGIIPILGWIAIIVFLCQPGTPAPNKYGPPA